MGHTLQPPMTGGYLDRDAATRLSEVALDEAWNAAHTTVLRLRDGLVPLRAHGGGASALDFTAPAGPRGPEHFYLGRLAGKPVFAVREKAADMESDAAQNEGSGGGLPAQTEPMAGWVHPFDCASHLSHGEAELLAVALAISAWHGSSGFSSRDGSPTTPVQGGWAQLDAQGGEHFPRTDPVVIVLVEHEDRVLLGSNALWEAGRFSLLAGFIDAGESAEQAVMREVFEEAGVRVQTPRYIASQPWPFPRSFMMGFRAQLADGVEPESAVPDPSELSEVRWFTRAELRTPPPGITLPRPLSIARWLIDLWVAEGDAESQNGAG